MNSYWWCKLKAIRFLSDGKSSLISEIELSIVFVINTDE